MTRFCWPQRVRRRGKPLQTVLVYRVIERTYRLPEEALTTIYEDREARLYTQSLLSNPIPGSWDYSDFVAANQKNSI